MRPLQGGGSGIYILWQCFGTKELWLPYSLCEAQVAKNERRGRACHHLSPWRCLSHLVDSTAMADSELHSSRHRRVKHSSNKSPGPEVTCWAAATLWVLTFYSAVCDCCWTCLLFDVLDFDEVMFHAVFHANWVVLDVVGGALSFELEVQTPPWYNFIRISIGRCGTHQINIFCGGLMFLGWWLTLWNNIEREDQTARK